VVFSEAHASCTEGTGGLGNGDFLTGPLQMPRERLGNVGPALELLAEAPRGLVHASVILDMSTRAAPIFPDEAARLLRTVWDSADYEQRLAVLPSLRAAGVSDASLYAR
jgi:hypothetical protein